MSATPSLKRRRVTRACESCRNLKAKCDGNQPICGRCGGYGHECRWNEAHVRKNVLEGSRANFAWLSMGNDGQKLRDAIKAHQNLIADIRVKLSPDDRKMIDLRLASIQLPEVKQVGSGAANTPESPEHLLVENRCPLPVQRYLGEASDIRFFHAVESSFGRQPPSDQQDGPALQEQVDSYEQERIRPGSPEQNQECLPHRTVADNLVNIYFSTIHIAYPFISEPDFRATYENFWQSDSLEGFRGPWLSMLLTIFALGSCYERVAEASDGTASNSHSWRQDVRYFDHAVAISQNYTSKRTVEHICALLTQSFYLLATCQTDRCWITLGEAVRIAQSMGLHVEEGNVSRGGPLSSRETGRRVWYSIFVLDRLLALQLGRPPSISDDDFNVKHPSRQSDDDLTDPKCHNNTHQQGWVGDYFIAMIKFSEIVGRVFHRLYGPKRSDDGGVTLSNIDLSDTELLQWRSTLRRKLRFDLSHTFESSKVFQNQRNMLAVKFYNLRALIHRPLLSFAKVTASSPNYLAWHQAEHRRISISKRKCIMAAQQTAKLLHNLENKKSLVYGFPWWQMISCLICASSILLVASICVDLNSETEFEVFEDIDWLAVDEDAEVCLQVFQALSSNSNAARLARDMMQRLKKTRMISFGTVRKSLSTALMPAVESRIEGVNVDLIDASTLDASMLSQLDFGGPSQDSIDLMFQNMPYEVSEPVMWSAQFVNESFNPFSHHLDA